MPKVVFQCFFLLTIATWGMTQEPSNAYLLEWKTTPNQKAQLTKLDLLTGFNQRGYNNQPFQKQDDIYLSSSWKENSLAHTNIITLNLKKKSIRQITDTEDAEFSPKLAGNNLYFIRLDKETKYQELWKYDGQTLEKVLPEINVAYFTPLSSERLAVVLIENNQLALYDINIKSNQKKRILNSVGRCLATDDKGILYFVHKYSPDIWYIKSYDLITGQIKIVCKTIPGAEDFFLEKDHFLWMAKDQRIYRVTIQDEIATPWDNLFNLEDYPLNNIGRLCVINDNQLIFINQ